MNSYESALWQTAIGLGDVGTNCAIAGGIVALVTGAAGIPAEWRRRRLGPHPVRTCAARLAVYT